MSLVFSVCSILFFKYIIGNSTLVMDRIRLSLYMNWVCSSLCIRKSFYVLFIVSFSKKGFFFSLLFS